jgi:hypothetical protein
MAALVVLKSLKKREAVIYSAMYARNFRKYSTYNYNLLMLILLAVNIEHTLFLVLWQPPVK